MEMIYNNCGFVYRGYWVDIVNKGNTSFCLATIQEYNQNMQGEKEHRKIIDCTNTEDAIREVKEYIDFMVNESVFAKRTSKSEKKNYMGELAAMLGVELDKPFYVIDNDGEKIKTTIKESGIRCEHDYKHAWCCVLQNILTGHAGIVRE